MFLQNTITLNLLQAVQIPLKTLNIFIASGSDITFSVQIAIRVKILWHFYTFNFKRGLALNFKDCSCNNVNTGSSTEQAEYNQPYLQIFYRNMFSQRTHNFRKFILYLQ